MDSVVRLDTFGFSEETVLRSQRSPGKLFFRVGLPTGGSLQQTSNDSGSVEVVDGGRTIARIQAPSARDAQGTVVPVGMSFSGDLLTLTIEHAPGQYAMPVMVVPVGH